MSEQQAAKIIELLEEIAIRLKKAEEDVARCGHGSTGLCMACVIVNDLLRPHR